MKKALLLVDIQNDFMPGGALAVPRGDEIIPIINNLISQFSLVIATQDWHPSDHVSFADNHLGKKVGDHVQINGFDHLLWPRHCVCNTPGAELDKRLNKHQINTCFFKGTDKWIDSYSAFFDNAHLKSTGLGDYLKAQGVDELYIAGVATEYCVLHSALDARDLGLTVYVVVDACRSINLNPGDEQKALAALVAKGANVILSSEISFE